MYRAVGKWFFLDPCSTAASRGWHVVRAPAREHSGCLSCQGGSERFDERATWMVASSTTMTLLTGQYCGASEVSEGLGPSKTSVSHNKRRLPAGAIRSSSPPLVLNRLQRYWRCLPSWYHLAILRRMSQYLLCLRQQHELWYIRLLP